MTVLILNKGQKNLFNIAATRSGAPVDLTGGDLAFIVKRNPGDTDLEAVLTYEIGTGIQLVDAVNGLTQLTIPAADTTSLDTRSLLFWRIVMNVGLGDEVIDDGTFQISVDPFPDTYITVQDVRDEGLADPPFSDAKIEKAIRTWQAFLDRATRQWFRPIELEMFFDGTDSDTLFFGVPIISIDELRMNGDPNALDPRYYKIYNSRSYPWDRHNPRIQLVDNRQFQGDIFTAPIRDGSMIFRKGTQNQYIRGTFGYVEEDGGAPELIKRALTKLVVEKLAKPIYADPSAPIPPPPPLVAGIVREEWTDGHKIKYATSGGDITPRAGSAFSGVTDDPEILRIISMYRAPIGIASPASPSYR